jgi:hypothetical protein
MTSLMNEVWGSPETEQQDLNELESNLKVFFAKHKNVRQVTLAPKHWFGHFFRVTMCELVLFPSKIYLSGNFKISQHKGLNFAPSPQISIFRLILVSMLHRTLASYTKICACLCWSRKRRSRGCTRETRRAKSPFRPWKPDSSTMKVMIPT